MLTIKCQGEHFTLDVSVWIFDENSNGPAIILSPLADSKFGPKGCHRAVLGSSIQSEGRRDGDQPRLRPHQHPPPGRSHLL